MPRVPVNLHEVKELEALTPGTYSVRLANIKDKKSSTGKDMEELKFACTDDGLNGRYLFTNILLEESAWWKWKELYDACGVPYDTGGFDTDDLRDAECKVTVDVEVYEGKTRNKVVNFLKF